MAHISSVKNSTSTRSKDWKFAFTFTKDHLYQLALWAIMARIVLYELFNSISLLSIGAFNVSPVDVTLLFCLPALFVSFRYFHPRRLSGILVMLFSLLMLVGLVRGSLSNGPVQAGFMFRANVLYVVSFLIAILMPLTEKRASFIVKAFVFTSWILILLVFFRLIVGNNGHRPLTSVGGILMGEAAVMALGLAMSPYLVAKEKMGWILIVIFFCVMLFLTGQRTALSASLAGLGVVLLLSPSPYRWIIRLFFLGVICAVGFIFVAALADFGKDALVEHLPGFIQDQFGKRTTLDWRKAQWAAAMRQFWASSAADQWLGMPFGTRVSYRLDGLFRGFVLHFSIHNHYIKTLVELGFVGIGIFAFTIIWALWKIMVRFGKRNREVYLSPEVSLALLVTILFFSYGYWLNGIQGIVLGSLIASRPRNRIGKPR